MDGEFSVVKTALHRYMIQSDVNSTDYLEVKDSETLKEYGEKHLAKPGSKSRLQSRHFVNLLPEEILARKTEVVDGGRTLDGISSKFQYICKVILIYFYMLY